jgi:hypothetical protein
MAADTTSASTGTGAYDGGKEVLFADIQDRLRDDCHKVRLPRLPSTPLPGQMRPTLAEWVRTHMFFLLRWGAAWGRWGLGQICCPLESMG